MYIPFMPIVDILKAIEDKYPGRLNQYYKDNGGVVVVPPPINRIQVVQTKELTRELIEIISQNPIVDIIDPSYWTKDDVSHFLGGLAGLLVNELEDREDSRNIELMHNGLSVMIHVHGEHLTELTTKIAKHLREIDERVPTYLIYPDGTYEYYPTRKSETTAAIKRNRTAPAPINDTKPKRTRIINEEDILNLKIEIGLLEQSGDLNTFLNRV